MPHPAPRAVIFDLDGVLYDFRPSERARYLSEITGLPAERIAAVFRSPFEAAAESGAYTRGEDYLAAFNRELGSTVTRAEWTEARRRAMRPHEEVLRLVAELEPARVVGMLTNNGPLLKDVLPELAPEVTRLLGSHAWVSFEFGARKPEPVIFRRLAERLLLPPASILFVDDAAANCEAARAAGLAALHFERPETSMRALRAVLSLP